MSDALSIAVNGLNTAVTRAAQSASNIANASLTGGSKVDQDLVNVKTASVDYAASATVIKTEEKNQKALLNILA